MLPIRWRMAFTDEMQRALAELPMELRESLLLVVVGELTHQETADVLGRAAGHGAIACQPGSRAVAG